MCLILIAKNVHPDYPLIIAANRDEFFNRPADPIHFWPEFPQILAGRDLQAGGTWLGVNKHGQFSAITNIREPDTPTHPSPQSRGKLVLNYLTTTQEPLPYLHQVKESAGQFNGFNLICGDIHSTHYYSNRQPHPITLSDGVHGISNAALNTPWPKLAQGKQALSEAVLRKGFSLQDLLPVLKNKQRPPDEALPNTGVDLATERMLSSRFIEDPNGQYGTRASTALRMNHQGIELIEWRWSNAGQLLGTEHKHIDF